MNCNSGFFGCNNIIWIIILILLFCNCGWGGNFNWGGNNCCDNNCGCNCGCN